MFKRCKVVMLPTNQESNIIKSKDLDFLTYVDRWSGKHLPQHLYILSDEEIKEGDCFYGVNTNHVYSTDRDAIKNKKKVIATTDSQLAYVSVFGIPSPSQSFIEKYIAEYNKGNVISDVMVEYACFDELEYNSKEFSDAWHNNRDYTLKINPKDNTITIRKIKDSWTRDEVIALCSKAMVAGSHSSTFEFEEWIESNL